MIGRMRAGPGDSENGLPWTTTATWSGSFLEGLAEPLARALEQLEDADDVVRVVLLVAGAEVGAGGLDPGHVTG